MLFRSLEPDGQPAATPMTVSGPLDATTSIILIGIVLALGVIVLIVYYRRGSTG